MNNKQYRSKYVREKMICNDYAHEKCEIILVSFKSSLLIEEKNLPW